VSFRRKLLFAFALTVLLSVSTVAWIASIVTRRAFEQADSERSAALVAQFRREFNRRGQEVASRVKAIAGSEAAARMAAESGKVAPDYGSYVNDAKNLAHEQQLDFLDFVDAQGAILSSAQWPAKFGYKESNFSPVVTKEAVLRQQETPEGTKLGLFAVDKSSRRMRRMTRRFRLSH
jgi:two-component system nitrogen regulation sensor histidine kinase NtrY